MPDGQDGLAGASSVALEIPPAAEPGRRVLLVSADAALRELLGEWLADAGWRACGQAECGQCDEASAQGVFDLLLADIPSPRQGGDEELSRLARAWPGVPVLALSASFFAGVEASGAVARSLGVAAVLPKPLSRDALLAAVHRLTGRAA